MHRKQSKTYAGAALDHARLPARAMTAKEQAIHSERLATVRNALSLLQLATLQGEDIQVARARLSDWLTDDADRWTT